LLVHARTGFREAAHAMFLPRFLGFSGSKDVYYGDVFQRALIADVLCDVDGAIGGVLYPLINAELDYLISRRSSVGIGGWSYFPELPELAPDADDLGQVLTALVRGGRRATALVYVSEPLRVLFSDCIHDDGSFETWIIPASERDLMQERQLAAARARWGTGADPEVVANLLYSLVLLGDRRFDAVCRRGASYLERSQHESGCWNARWYFGPYYGTYVCMRLLRLLRPTSESLVRGAEFIRRTQLVDGTWAQHASKAGDPMSTALALLALAAVRNGVVSARDSQRAERARAALDRRRKRGGWASAPFIRPSGVHCYGSRTLTTAMVTKAALAWSAIANEERARSVVHCDGDRSTSRSVPPSPMPERPAPR
jgi:squalene-hopene/tetraprenyl-beta-curcumene cyclase